MAKLSVNFEGVVPDTSDRRELLAGLFSAKTAATATSAQFMVGEIFIFKKIVSL